MSKRIVFVLFIVIVLLAVCIPLRAQENTSPTQTEEERANQDYLFQFSSYTEAHQAYITAKEAYQKFGTITSQQEAVQKTKIVLILRAEVIRTYLQRLKLRLIAQRELDSIQRESQVGKLEATQAFLETHKQNIDKIKNLAEVNTESSRFEREMPATNELSYETLSFILIGEAQGLEVSTRNLLEETIQSLGNPSSRAFEEGVSEIRRKLTAVRVNADRASQIIQEYQTAKIKKGLTAIGTYQLVQKEMKSAKLSLQEAAQLIIELENLKG